MPAPKKPQDHRPKKSDAFTFEDKDGKTHSLPPATNGLEKISGRAMRDAMMGGDEGEVRLGFSLLEACGADEAAVDALYDLPALEMIRIIASWMQASEVSAGATLGESQRSST